MGEEPKDEDEDCEECDLKDVPVGIANEICKISDGTDEGYCDQIFEEVINDEISVDEYMDKVIEHAKDDSKAQDTLKELRGFYEEAKKKYGKE